MVDLYGRGNHFILLLKIQRIKKCASGVKTEVTSEHTSANNTLINWL